MKTSSAKAKGRRFQQFIRDRLNFLLEPFTGVQQSVESQIMGESGEDIVVHPMVRKIFPFSFECKNQERFSIWKAMEQAEANAPEGTIPIVAFKRNRTKPRVVINWDDFEGILNAYTESLSNG